MEFHGFAFEDEDGLVWDWVGRATFEGTVSSDDGEFVMERAVQAMNRFFDSCNISPGYQIWVFRKVKRD